MGRCDTCGNEYANTMEIRQQGRAWTFDSFECAIHTMAPTCAHCGCRMVGHGVEGRGGMYYCCGHCAEKAGVPDREVNP